MFNFPTSSSDKKPKEEDDPFRDLVDLDSEKDPNEVKIYLTKGKKLVPSDRDMFGNLGTADPRVRFVLETGQTKEPSVVSESKTNTLEPVWNEMLSMKITKFGTTLKAYVEDWDLNGVDDMGSVSVNVEKKRLGLQWYALKKGFLEFAVFCWYNPDADHFDPFQHDRESFIPLLKPPNELRIAVFRAKGLKGDLPTPRVTAFLRPPKKAKLVKKEEDAEVPKQNPATPFDEGFSTAESMQKTLRPVFKEILTIPNVHPPQEKVKSAADFPSVQLKVEDVQMLGATELGTTKLISLGDLLAKQNPTKPKWYALNEGALQVALYWAYNKDLDEDGDRNATVLSYLTPDFLEDAIEAVVKSGEELFYDVMNTMILIADIYEISQEWKLAVDAISVIVGLTPTVNDAIAEAQDIASIFIKILASATGNPAAIAHFSVEIKFLSSATFIF